MKRNNFDHLNCSVAATLSVIGDHWSLLIVRDAFFGVRRFDDFQADLGIARNVLSLRLKKLVDEGIMTRARGTSGFQEYQLTPAGLDLQPILLAMTHWGDCHRPHPQGPRITFVDKTHREPVEKMTVRSQRGQILGPKDIRAKAGPGFHSGQKDVPLLQTPATSPR